MSVRFGLFGFRSKDPDADLSLKGLHNFHYVVLVGSLLLTLVVWTYATRGAERQSGAAFDNAVTQALELVTERMKSYEDALRAGVGLFSTNGGAISHASWRSFAETLRIDQQYPGINGIGVIFHVPGEEMDAFLARQRETRPDFALHPDHDRGVNMPITFIEPETPNAKAVGLDMAFEDNRFRALIAARDTGEPRITGPITLVQDAEATPGFLFYSPFYSDTGLDSLSARQADFAGAVYAPFVMKKLMQGVLDRTKRQVWVSISDGSTVLYDEHQTEDEGHDPAPLFSRTVDMDMYGRTWTVDLRTNVAFREANVSVQPTIILICGLMIDALLLGLFTSMARSNHRAIAYADQVTTELQKEKRDLMTINEALEQFSYVASHDLKTPIRSMRDATDYLMEDLADRHPEAMRDTEILRQFGELTKLNRRMDALVKGVLECAQIPVHAEPAHPTNPYDLIRDLGEQLRLTGDQLRLEGAFPDLHVSTTAMKQIFGNLLSNAATHANGPDPLRIIVTGEQTEGGAILTVADNGPGIDPQYHEKIFEMFQSLDPGKTEHSTGIGLAIVRKAVDSVDGTIVVRSRPGEGTRFIVTFPTSLVADLSEIAAE